ncbi:unnamed protein product [Brachionus calyciflorus]|uniref:LicD/FKTN/FKRP nucleotidyltransferase domain-containing protein n=1 Tax=Brachionus calyciflorus TaxID=104777 RepID=A0A814J1B3_9BILA|nr:unnamed protein product [Brachionus calyciflorus]
MASNLEKDKFNQDKRKNMFFTTKMIHFKNIIDSIQMDYWLAAGTLLGWYRHCGIIPFTTDIDVGMDGDKYDPLIESKFTNDKILPLSVKFGLDNDSLGLRLGNKVVTLGISFNYEINTTHLFFPYHSQREVKGVILRKIESLCSAELFNEKYTIPCDPIKYFEDVYGINGWQYPQEKIKTSPFLILWKKWSISEWRNAIKFFHNGIYLKEETEKFINNYI